MFSLFIACILLIVWVWYESSSKNQLQKKIDELKLKQETLSDQINTLNLKNSKLQGENKKLKEQNHTLQEAAMPPSELKESRAKKQRAENYKLWNDELSRDISTGAKKFVWRCMQDSRVCEKCKKLNGKTFTKKDIPELKKFYKAHKGDYGCRCYLESY